MKHIILTLISIVIVLSTTSCASHRSITGNVNAITAKVDAHLQAFNLDENAKGTLKMKRGEAIQLSLTKFGIEGVRVIFTPDSMLVINKLTKTYLRTSFREADRLLGGEGLVTFDNIENFFWSESKMADRQSTIPVAGFVPLDLETKYSRTLKAGKYRVPQKINMKMSGAEGAIETGEMKIELSKVKAADSWQPNTEISSKYKNLNVLSLIKNLLKNK